MYNGRIATRLHISKTMVMVAVHAETNTHQPEEQLAKFSLEPHAALLSSIWTIFLPSLAWVGNTCPAQGKKHTAAAHDSLYMRTNVGVDAVGLRVVVLRKVIAQCLSALSQDQ